MLLEQLVVGLAEGQAEVGQRLELVGFHDGQGCVGATHTGVEHCDELGLGRHHRRGSARPVVDHVLLAERKKFHQVVREGLEVHMQLLLRLQSVEILF